MSSTAELVRSEGLDHDWIVLHDPAPEFSTQSRVRIVGSGVNARGVIARGDVRRPPRTLTALPPVDDLT